MFGLLRRAVAWNGKEEGEEPPDRRFVWGCIQPIVGVAHHLS
jgi:hypothetical protein